MERLTYRGTQHMTEDGIVVPAYSDYGIRRIIERLADYEDAEEQRLLYRKIFIITDYCNKPSDCPWDCSVCSDNHLIVDELVVEISQIKNNVFGILNETVFLTKEEAEHALAEMKGV